ncbi:MAG: beta-N-acetylhexosaminidase [Bacteroidota bacterium]
MYIKKKRTSALVLFLLFFVLIKTNGQVSIIPKPAIVDLQKGEFVIDAHTAIQYPVGNKDLALLSSYFSNYIENISGYSLLVNKKGKKTIHFILTKIDSLGKEGYQLNVSTAAIFIKANNKAGLFYGLQSLIQTLPAVRTNETLQVPAMDITDYPHFKWRGLMLDVSRHFYSVQAIKEIIDLMALYKMNVFHWHLCDDEGWRLEIKKYPRLTSVGAWRKEIPGSVFYKKDSTLKGKASVYGGYYTQQQAKEVVAYAQARNITVIPEIEMPGHSGAALAAYPQFSCTQHAQEVPNSAIFNGVVNLAKVNFNYCAGNDSSFLFLQNILKEVMEIFPSEYIHIGGDEVDKSYWKQCPKCQQRIQKEGLKDEEGLQSYFIHRVEKFLLAHHKKLLGWDEILEGGLAPSATVVSWRGEKGGIAAAKLGHNVIMSPSDPLYFNRYQAGPEGEPYAAKYSINTLQKVYNYNPYPKALSGMERNYILGGQCGLWTEFIYSVEDLEYMLLPRMPAVAEALWSKPENKNFDDFVTRLNQWHFNSWQQKGIRFYQGNWIENIKRK